MVIKRYKEGQFFWGFKMEMSNSPGGESEGKHAKEQE